MSLTTRRQGKSIMSQLSIAWDAGSKDESVAVIFDEEGKIFGNLPIPIVKSGEIFTCSIFIDEPNEQIKQ